MELLRAKHSGLASGPDAKEKAKERKKRVSDKGNSSDEYTEYYVSKDGSEHDIHRKRLRRKVKEKAKSFGQVIKPKKQKKVKKDKERSMFRIKVIAAMSTRNTTCP